MKKRRRSRRRRRIVSSDGNFRARDQLQCEASRVRNVFTFSALLERWNPFSSSLFKSLKY